MTQSFRFDDVLYAFDMKAPALRRWLQFGLIGNNPIGAEWSPSAREGWLRAGVHRIPPLSSDQSRWSAEALPTALRDNVTPSPFAARGRSSPGSPASLAA